MKRPASAVLFLPFLFYILLPTREFYWDGISFALDIERAKGNLSSLLRPNHLIYNPAGYLFYECFGEKVRALFLLQALNGILGGITILLVYHLLKKITGSRFHSACLALMMAFSATWWKFATDANAYIPSVLCLLVAFKWLLQEEKPRPVSVGVIHAVAMLLHQLAIFFYPVAWICLRRQKQKWPGLLQYSAVSFLITAGVCISAYRHISPAGGFWDWLTTHSADSGFTFSILHNAAVSIGGNCKLFFGGKIAALRFDAITILGILGLAVTLGWLFARRDEIRRGFQEFGANLKRQYFPESSAPIIWILCYLLFLLFWMPKNTFYRLFYLPAVFILIGALGRPWKEKAGHGFIAAVLVLFFWNFAFFIYPNSRRESNEIYSFALQHREDWPRGTTIVFSEFHSDLWTIRYFNPQASWVEKGTVSEIAASSADSPLWLEGTAYDRLKQQPDGERWLAAHVDMARSLIYHSRKHTMRFYRAL
jgi:hypothetical protein